MATGQLFSRNTQALFYNYKQLPIQRMLDFDFLCGVYQSVSALNPLLFVLILLFVGFLCTSNVNV